MRNRRLGNLAFILDERLSKEKQRVLVRVVNAIRQVAQVDLYSGNISEEDLVQKLHQKNYDLILAPWYRYLNWSKIEGFYGLTRTSGPTFAGYFADQLNSFEMGEPSDHLRAILIDFANLTPREIITVIRTLIQDKNRTGIRPIFEGSPPIYCESWLTPHGLGSRIEAVLSIPEVANSDWSRRSNAIRIIVMSMWSMIYEEGPGMGEILRAIGQTYPRAYFQVGADGASMAFRLWFSMASLGPTDAVKCFWPGQGKPSSPAQLLLRFSDLVRVHRIAETQDVEVVAVLHHDSAPSISNPNQVHTLWVEPITLHLVTELPYEMPSAAQPQLRALTPPLQPVQPQTQTQPQPQARDRALIETAMQIKKLKDMLAEKDELIRDLRMGGVGMPAQIPPPDEEGLLEAFQERYHEARFQIRQFEISIHDAETKGATTNELDQLRQKMQALEAREQAWIRRLATILETYRNARNQDSKSSGPKRGNGAG